MKSLFPVSPREEGKKFFVLLRLRLATLPWCPFSGQRRHLNSWPIVRFSDSSESGIPHLSPDFL